jgi:predicted dehydrogenase
MNTIWLVGTGAVGIEYAKVLDSLKINYIAVGRGDANALKFETASGHAAIRGGVDKFIGLNPEIATHAIVAVGVEELSSTAIALIKAGVKNILLEKPGICEPGEINELVKISREKSAHVVLAYNRRFYASVLKAEEIISDDMGVTSFNFEFTEWAHKIGPMSDGSNKFSRWFLANSTHVADLAFYLGGKPEQMSSFHIGGLTWHPSASVFSGAGVSIKGALFSYQANWEAPGRWVVEICTKKHRLYFKPMESLQIQENGSVTVNPVIIDDHLDKEFKPGFYLQTKSFLTGELSRFCTIEEQKEMIEKYYTKISGY